MASENFANALRRYGGMWGSAWRDGRMLTDVVQVTATTQRGRAEIPLVGRQRVGYKPTRLSSEGSIAFQKIDTGWELDVYNAMTLDVDALRAARDRGDFGTLDGTFDLQLKHDDPHAFGKESWAVKGCMIWQMDIGINTTDDFIQREIPLTFDEAVPLTTFRVVGGQVQRVHQLGA
jgi:hypothetical protein